MQSLRNAIGILHETKNRWERRVPLVPDAVANLVRAGIEVRVQTSPSRAFADADYAAAGATIVSDVTDCRMMLGVKEVKVTQVQPGQTVLCFSHTIKGQAHNMPLLAHFLRSRATLIDYECIVDAAGVRQVAFGRYAGLAGAHETLWTLEHRLVATGKPGFAPGVRHAVEYRDLAEMVHDVRARLDAYTRSLGSNPRPCVLFGITGEGRVSKGALEYLEEVGIPTVSLDRALSLIEAGAGAEVPFATIMIPDAWIYERAGRRAFEFSDYLAHPEQYICKAPMYLLLFTAWINGSYWDERFPRVLDASTASRMLANGTLPTVIGDIACDIGGGVEWTILATQNDEPAFVYDPATRAASVGVEGEGAVIMSVDNLPCALPRDASVDFSKALEPFVRPFFEANFDAGVPSSLSPVLQRAVVAANGELGPHHAGLTRSLPPGSVG